MIAIVDDDSDIRDALCDLFLVEGLACRAFESGEAFHAAYAPGAFALVVTDVRMSGMTGLELLARVRQSEPDLPVIVVTAATDAHLRQKVLEGGAQELLVKPIRNADLLGL